MIEKCSNCSYISKDSNEELCPECGYVIRVRFSSKGVGILLDIIEEENRLSREHFPAEEEDD